MAGLTAQNAPDRETVKAYMLALSNEAGKMMLADLEKAVEAVSRDKTDKEGRIDPYKLAMADAVREFLRRMKRVADLASDPEWQRIDAARQVAEAAGRL